MNFEKESVAELKLKLIQQILEADFETMAHRKSLAPLLAAIELNEEIDFEVATSEMQSMSSFNALHIDKSFFIKDIEEIFNKNIDEYDHLHIYFIEVDQNISLLFRFNSDSSNDFDEGKIKIYSDETLYILKDKSLELVQDHQMAINCITSFKKRYDACKFDQNQFSYTQYVTFDSYNIKKHYKGFPDVSEFCTAAKKDPVTGKLRQNILYKIDRKFVNNPKTDLDDVFFNIGNMQP